MANLDNEQAMVDIAHAALIDSGHPDLCALIFLRSGFLQLQRSIPDPKIAELVIKAIMLAHQALSHTVAMHHRSDAIGFTCIECGFLDPWDEL